MRSRPGGQAAATSRIENFLGFPFGVSGGDLIGQASLQALKFGVRVYAPCEAVEPRGRRGRRAGGDPRRRPRHPRPHGDRHRGRRVPPRCSWSAGPTSSGAGIYYAAHAARAAAGARRRRSWWSAARTRRGRPRCTSRRNGCPVHLVVRGADLGLAHVVVPRRPARRGSAHPGAHRLERGGAGRRRRRCGRCASTRRATISARGLFCFIGADPATCWLHGAGPDDRRLHPHRHRRDGTDAGSAGRRSAANRCRSRPRCRGSSPPGTCAADR